MCVGGRGVSQKNFTRGQMKVTGQDRQKAGNRK